MGRSGFDSCVASGKKIANRRSASEPATNRSSCFHIDQASFFPPAGQADRIHPNPRKRVVPLFGFQFFVFKIGIFPKQLQPIYSASAFFAEKCLFRHIPHTRADSPHNTIVSINLTVEYHQRFSTSRTNGKQSNPAVAVLQRNMAQERANRLSGEADMNPILAAACQNPFRLPVWSPFFLDIPHVHL